jgi:hypothetical protein
MNRIQTTINDLFWSAAVVTLGCTWTLGIRLAIACRLLDDHQAGPSSVAGISSSMIEWEEKSSTVQL